jgi:hypothetical protein
VHVTARDFLEHRPTRILEFARWTVFLGFLAKLEIASAIWMLS